MSGAVERVSRRYRLQPTEGRSIAFWGVILLSLTEGVLFVVLLFSYYYLWSIAPEWPPAGVEPPKLFEASPWNVLLRTVVLLSSSLTIWFGERALRRGNRRGAIVWTTVTIAMAAYFLAGHLHEFLVKVPEEFLWSDHAYGSIYYTVLNFHGAHVVVGILIWAFILLRLGQGAYGPDDDTEFATSSIYWHFVDAIWVFVFTTMYVFPNLLPGG